MRLQREYVDHVARAVVERLMAAEMIETATPGAVIERVHQVLLEELSIEDRINDKVRAYMNQYEDQIRRTGVSYQEMFKRIKSELVRREKVIL
ncbi:MAG TPA: DUF507 family protein [Candidatus Acidoferrales bacterium]|nr:DUF507 family protein [Candidatus Acidoferrales bacterium]